MQTLSKNIEELTYHDLERIMMSLLDENDNSFTITYRNNGFLTKELTDKLLEHAYSYKDEVHQYDYILRTIRHTNTLTIKDINKMILSIVNNTQITNGIEFILAIKKNCPEIAKEVNYVPLIDKTIIFLMMSNNYDETLKWIYLSDNIGKCIIERFIMSGEITNFINTLNSINRENYLNSDYYFSVFMGKEPLLRKLDSGDDTLRVEDLIRYYSLSNDLFLGVSI